MKTKRIVSVLMSLVLVMAVFMPVPVFAEGSAASETVLYSNDFSGTALSDDWNVSNATNAQVNGETLNNTGKGTFWAYLSQANGATQWEDYAVEADVMITATKTDTTDTATTGIAIRSSADSWYGGYMMKLNYKDQKIHLYSGKADGTTGLITLKSASMSIELNRSYHLKLVTIGEEIIGYVNGDVVLEYTANSTNMTEKTAKKNDKGYPGVLINDGTVTIDNFMITSMKNSVVIENVREDETATVYVDGKESAIGKQTRIVRAYPGQSVQIISDTQNTVYLVKADGTVVQPECLQNAIDYVGTAIRTTENQGIRFKSSITKTAKAGDEEFTLKEYGTVVTKETILNGDDLYLGDTYATVKGVAYEKDSTNLIFAETDTLVQFTGVLINIAESNYSTTYVARPYTIFEDTNGTQYKIYGNMVERSLVEIARLALDDTEYDYTESEKTYFQSIVDEVTGGQTE